MAAWIRADRQIGVGQSGHTELHTQKESLPNVREREFWEMLSWKIVLALFRLSSLQHPVSGSVVPISTEEARKTSRVCDAFVRGLTPNCSRTFRGDFRPASQHVYRSMRRQQQWARHGMKSQIRDLLQPFSPREVLKSSSQRHVDDGHGRDWERAENLSEGKQSLFSVVASIF